MHTQTVQSAASVVLSRPARVETIANAFRFLNAMNTPAILVAMQSVGYSAEEHAEGWKLFLSVSHEPTVAKPAAPVNVSAQAISEIESWNGQGFRRARAVLDRKFPEVSAFIFADIDGSVNGPVYDLATFLDRCKDLESGADRKGSRKSDHAALAALASRGIGKAELTHLASLVEDARVQPEPAPAPVDNGARTAAITELYLWLRDWRETARAVIKNRTHLRMLGIGGKKGKKNAAPVPSPVTVTPVVAAPSAPIAALPAGAPANDAVANVG